MSSLPDRQTSGDATAPVVQAEVAFLLEDLPDPDLDWRYRIRVSHGSASGWVEVAGTGEPPATREAKALVLRRSEGLPRESLIPLLEAMSPLQTDADD